MASHQHPSYGPEPANQHIDLNTPRSAEDDGDFDLELGVDADPHSPQQCEASHDESGPSGRGIFTAPHRMDFVKVSPSTSPLQILKRLVMAVVMLSSLISLAWQHKEDISQALFVCATNLHGATDTAKECAANYHYESSHGWAAGSAGMVAFYSLAAFLVRRFGGVFTDSRSGFGLGDYRPGSRFSTWMLSPVIIPATLLVFTAIGVTWGGSWFARRILGARDDLEV